MLGTMEPVRELDRHVIDNKHINYNISTRPLATRCTQTSSDNGQEV